MSVKFKLDDIVKVTEERLKYENSSHYYISEELNSFKVIEKLPIAVYDAADVSVDKISGWSYDDVYRLCGVKSGLVVTYHSDFLELDIEVNREKKIKEILK